MFSLCQNIEVQRIESNRKRPLLMHTLGPFTSKFFSTLGKHELHCLQRKILVMDIGEKHSEDVKEDYSSPFPG